MKGAFRGLIAGGIYALVAFLQDKIGAFFRELDPLMQSD